MKVRVCAMHLQKLSWSMMICGISCSIESVRKLFRYRFLARVRKAQARKSGKENEAEKQLCASHKTFAPSRSRHRLHRARGVGSGRWAMGQIIARLQLKATHTRARGQELLVALPCLATSTTFQASLHAWAEGTSMPRSATPSCLAGHGR